MQTPVLTNTQPFPQTSPQQPTGAKIETGQFAGLSTHQIQPESQLGELNTPHQVECKLRGGGKERTVDEMTPEELGREILAQLNPQYLKVFHSQSNWETLLDKCIDHVTNQYHLEISSSLVATLKETIRNRASVGLIRSHLTAILLSSSGENYQKCNAAMHIGLRLCVEWNCARIDEAIDRCDKAADYSNSCISGLNALLAACIENMRPSGTFYPGGRENVQKKLIQLQQALQDTSAHFASTSKNRGEQGTSLDSIPWVTADKSSLPANVQNQLAAEFIPQLLAATEEHQDNVLQRLEERAAVMFENLERCKALQDERYRMRFRTCREQAAETTRFN
ncbi:hypothetical protein [Parendozoicomonas sp. Alg238-R29]|uniref:hypothetical protein n=1 Tax=Parendozoicomonas sp. Alg238-R29 TaxID=2993446 RepID=UPI00248EB082|nr:hypothetical protein [Parendozoicomonas sp. Alg238-R29]